MAIAHARDHLRRAQRVSAEFEEVVVNPDALHTQDIRPLRCEQPLDGRARRDIIGHGLGADGVWRGERGAIEFSVRRQRQCLEPHRCGGQHVVRQRGLQVLP